MNGHFRFMRTYFLCFKCGVVCKTLSVSHDAEVGRRFAKWVVLDPKLKIAKKQPILMPVRTCPDLASCCPRRQIRPQKK